MARVSAGGAVGLASRGIGRSQGLDHLVGGGFMVGMGGCWVQIF